MTFTPTATATLTLTPTATMTFTPTATFTLTATYTAVPTKTSAPVSSGGECSGGNTGIESQVVALINQQRANAGLSQLTANGALTSAARAHSKDMATNNFFSHTGSNGSDPFSRMRAAGYSFSAAGENVYGGEGQYNTAYSAVSRWMGSDGHRKIMLDPIYTQVGVGYWCSSDSKYEGYFTADFGRP